MADVSKLKLDNVTYNLKDASARASIASFGTAVQKDYATKAIGTQGEDVTALPTVEQVKNYVAPLVSGSMHFKGIFDELPSETDYVAGDVVIVGTYDSEGTLLGRKEYVLVEPTSGTKAWEELGDEEGLYATTVQLDAVKGAGWTNETVKGNADDIKVLDTSTENLESTVGNTQDPVVAGTVLYRLDTIEGKPAYSISSNDISSWNGKQDAITDGSATVASVAGNVVTLNNVSQSGGTVTTGSQAVVLAAIAKTGNASDLTTDSTHRLVTDAQIDTWNSSSTSGLIKSVDVEFNVDANGKLEFASGYNALTDTEKNKLSGISNGANQVTVPNEGAGTISIDGVSKNIALPNTVQDANYRHIDVTETSVTAAATGSSAAVTFNKYVHPAGSGASKSLDLYKISTDGTSHIASATAVTGADIAGYLNFITAYDATSNKIATAADIAGGIHFKGSTNRQTDSEGVPTETYEQALARLVPNPENGDMAIVDSKEFIYNTNILPNAWVEIGDESAYDPKGSADAAQAAAESYADGLIAALDSSASAGTNKALSSITVADGLITSSSTIDIPTDTGDLTNGADYATKSEVNTAIQNAIYDAIDATYRAGAL